MPAVNDNALSKFVGELYVAPISNPSNLMRLASVRGLQAITDNTVNTVEINADDTGTIIKGSTPENRIEGSFLENVDRDVIQRLLGGTASNVAGTIVAGALQETASGAWAYGAPIVIANQNGSGAPVVVNAVEGATDGVLTVNVDYVVGQDYLGHTVITMLSGGNITTLAQVIEFDYDYTPNASENITISAVFREDPRVWVEIHAENESGDERKITLTDATFEGQYNIQFVDLEQAGDLEGTTFVFKGARGSSLIIENEII